VQPSSKREVVAQVDRRELDAAGARVLLAELEGQLRDGDQVIISYTVYRKNPS